VLAARRPARQRPARDFSRGTDLSFGEPQAMIVSNDEFEGGERALLNYGHTLAHALEVLALHRDRDELRHGEAVAIGLGYAARLAYALGRVDASVITNHDEVLKALGLPFVCPKISAMSTSCRMGTTRRPNTT